MFKTAFVVFGYCQIFMTNILNNVKFALEVTKFTERHLMTTVINTHKDSFMFLTVS